MSSKGKKDNHHSGDHEAGRKHSPIHTDTRVHGGIEIHPSPILVKQDESERKDDKADNKKNYEVSRATAIATTIYCGLTFLLVLLSMWNVKIARDTFNITNRPYVGIDEVNFAHISKNDAGQAVPSPTPTKESVTLGFDFRFKNFGLGPARNAIIDWTVRVGDETMPSTKVLDTPATMYPSQDLHLRGGIDGEHYTSVMSGTKILRIDFRVKYDGPAESESYCEREQYNPIPNVFFNLGNVCGK